MIWIDKYEHIKDLYLLGKEKGLVQKGGEVRVKSEGRKGVTLKGKDVYNL